MTRDIISAKRRSEIDRLVSLVADEIIRIDGDPQDKLYFLLEVIHPQLRSDDDDGDEEIAIGCRELDRREAELLAQIAPRLRATIVNLLTEAAFELASPEAASPAVPETVLN